MLSVIVFQSTNKILWKKRCYNNSH